MLHALTSTFAYSGDRTSFQRLRFAFLSLRLFLFFFFFVRSLPAQAPTGELNGVVADPSGGVIARAAVRLTNASGASVDTTTNRDGFYEVKGLVPGVYTLKAVAKGFAIFTQENIQILPGKTRQLNIGLVIQIEEEKVEVTDSSTKVDVDPSNNAGTVVMKGKDLEALSDDPDELQSELQALAGPSAGPNGGQIYIDGFTAGQLPPQSFHPRDSNQSESVFLGIRQTGLWPDRNLDKTRNRSVARPDFPKRQLERLQFSESI
jgi:hypothetical protein